MDLSAKWTRRQLLRLTPATLLTLGAWPGARGAEDVGMGEIRFVVFNDLHVVDRACITWLEGIVGGLKSREEKLDFCLLAGDLSEHGKPEQLAGVRDLFRKLGVPVRVVIGNHDWRANDDRKPYEDAFPGSLNYSFEVKGWQVVGLDCSHGLRAKVAAQPATLRWLDDNVGKLDRKKPTVLVTHFPLGPKVPNRVTNADEVLKRLAERNLRGVFGGHHHGLTERKVGSLVLTTNRCCSLRARNHDGSKQKGYFLCHGKEGVITRKFIEVKVP